MQQSMRIAYAALTIALGVATRACAQEYSVVVNDAVPATRLTATELGRVFEKRATRWPNGLEVEPVDQGEESPLRERFSRDVLGKTVGQAKSYWQALVFSGRAVPPVEMTNDARVLEYVRLHTGAVGYVSQGARLPEGVRRLNVSW